MRLTKETKLHRLFLVLRLSLFSGLILLNLLITPNIATFVRAQPGSPVASISPSTSNWGIIVGSVGDVHIGINRNGIAVRIEVPREFASIVAENDTSFIQSDIRNDYYYYNVVDEARHWSYDWKGLNSSAPCSKPNFAYFDPNAPWCTEIWNYLNGTFRTFTATVTAPKTVKLTLKAPLIAGNYSFQVFVANRTNNLNLPDFLNAWNETLAIPVTMTDNPVAIRGTIMDCYVLCEQNSFVAPIKITAKGIAYALHNGKLVARAYVDETTGDFALTGLDPRFKSYDVQASAGLFQEPDGTHVAFQLSNPVNIGTCSFVPILSCPKRLVTLPRDTPDMGYPRISDWFG